jgi:acetyl-CoA carboxylase carboxyltransferase component
VSGLDPSHSKIRRLEAPVLVDRRGTTWALGVIDVTVRHGDRTVLAESPVPGLSAELARSVREAAVRFAGAKGKPGAFTVSFLADPAKGEHRFSGTAAGLPEAVAVLESLNELDLPSLEAHLSRGGTLDGELPEPRGTAMQAALSALDPEDGFAPRPGVVESLRLPAGAGLRADPAVEEGSVPSAPGFLIARITAHGRNPTEALHRLQRGIAATAAVVSGGTTDKAFLTEVLDRPELAGHGGDPEWLDRLVASGEHLPRRGAEVALLAVAIAAYEEESAAARARFYESAARGRPEVPREIGRAVVLRHRGHTYRLNIARVGHDLFRIETDGRRLEVRAGLAGRTGRSLACGEKGWRVSLAPQGSRKLVEVDGIPHRIEQEEDAAAARDEGPGKPADTGATGERRVRFDGLEAAPEAAPLEDARRLLLGYDVVPHTVQRRLAGPAGTQGDSLLEREILRAFVDVSALFRRQPAAGEANEGRHSAEEYLFTYLRDLDSWETGLPPAFLGKLRHALAHYGVGSLDRSLDLEESLFRIAISHQRLPQQVPAVLALLERNLERGDRPGSGDNEFRGLLERMISETQGTSPAVHDLAREVRYRLFDRPVLLAARERAYVAAEADLALLANAPGPEEGAERVRALVDCTQPLHRILSQRFASAGPAFRQALLEIMVRRFYRIRELQSVAFTAVDGQAFAIAGYDYQGSHVHLIASHAGPEGLAPSLAAVRGLAAKAAPRSEIVADLYFWSPGPQANEDAAAAEIAALLVDGDYPQDLRRAAVTASSPAGIRNFTFRRGNDEAGADGAFREERIYRGIHPMMALRLQLWRLQNFQLERLPSSEEVFFFHGVAHENPRDERLFAIAEVRDLTPVLNAAGRVVQLPQLEHMLMEALAGIRRFQARRAPAERLQWNRVLLYAWPPVDLRPDELDALVRRLSPLAEGLGLEKVAVRCRIPDPQGGELRDWVLEISNPTERGMVLRFRKPKEVPLKPLREYAQKVVDLRRRGLPHPYEVVKLLAPPRRDAQAPLPAGSFEEHDLDETGRLVPVSRPYGGNQANVVVGIVRNETERYPEGMARVILVSDPSRGMGTLAEPECRRILAALDLAQNLGVPLEWFALSAGARIAVDSGTEVMDWTAKVLRRLVELTQAGQEINIVVMGINAGPQPYWNAEAAMLMHTRGIVIMTPEGAMVSSGKQALDSSGGVSAEDNQGIGGYERIMGPNGQAQYFARDLAEACRILLRYYEHSYTALGERFPRTASTRDPLDRDIREFPHDVDGAGGGDLPTVGDIFSETANPGRKKPFDIRCVMAAVIDQDHEPLERWYGMRDAEIAVVWDAHLGGRPVCLLGFESKPLPRLGWAPVYGPDHWTGGTLFPLAAKKVARAINAASGNRPLVVLANLTGFDGSPESMRQWQLEYGAEIGRAVVSFKGPIVFCVIGHYHGGASLVFSAALQDNLEVAAVEGSHVSMLDGAAAAAVILAREPSESRGKAVAEFDQIHSVERARSVGSIHHVIAPERLRPYLIDAVERGMGKVTGGGEP